MEDNGGGSSSTATTTITEPTVVPVAQYPRNMQVEEDDLQEAVQVSLQVEMRRGSEVGVEDPTPVRLCRVDATFEMPAMTEEDDAPAGVSDAKHTDARVTNGTATPPGTPTEEGEARVPAKGVRFANADAGADAEMDRLEQYERRLRANTREALQLVDRLCELQQGQTEAKRTPRPTPASPIDAPPRRRSSTDADDAKLASVRSALKEGVHAMGSADASATSVNGAQDASRTEIGEGADLDVESVRVSARLLGVPVDCVLLPGRQLLVVDAQLGLSLICLQTRQLLRNLPPPADGTWRNAQCACLGGVSGGGSGKDGSAEGTGSSVYVLVEYDVRNSKKSEDNQQQQERRPTTVANGRLIPEVEFDRRPQPAATSSVEVADGPKVAEQPPQPQAEAANGPEVAQQQPQAEYERYICRFAMPDMRLVDRIEAPKWLRERVVTGCRMCYVPQTECLYLVANTPNQGFLYELRIAQGRWTECAGTKRHRQYSDLHAFAVVGPVTELLLVETNRCYVQMVSVYGSNIVSDRMLGLCERPGALCVDERGSVFVHDRAASKVGLHSRAQCLQKCGDVALVERANCRLAARQGVLAVLCTLTRELRLHRYDDAELCRRAELLPEGMASVW